MTAILVQYLEQAASVALIWGPLLIILFMAIESSFIPFPSEVVMIPAGFLAARGEIMPAGHPLLAVWLAILCGVIGSMIGAFINYVLAAKLGRPLLYRYGKWFFLKPEALTRAEEVFREYGELATFVCRLLPAIRQLISIPAGLSRMHVGRFSFFTALGATIWVIILTFVGYHFGVQARDMTYAELVPAGKGLLHHYMWEIMVGCAVLVVAYIWVHKRIMHGRRTSPPGADQTAP